MQCPLTLLLRVMAPGTLGLDALLSVAGDLAALLRRQVWRRCVATPPEVVTLPGGPQPRGCQRLGNTQAEVGPVLVRVESMGAQVGVERVRPATADVAYQAALVVFDQLTERRMVLPRPRPLLGQVRIHDILTAAPARHAGRAAITRVRITRAGHDFGAPGAPTNSRIQSR